MVITNIPKEIGDIAIKTQIKFSFFIIFFIFVVSTGFEPVFNCTLKPISCIIQTMLLPTVRKGEYRTNLILIVRLTNLRHLTILFPYSTSLIYDLDFDYLSLMFLMFSFNISMISNNHLISCSILSRRVLMSSILSSMLFSVI